MEVTYKWIKLDFNGKSNQRNGARIFDQNLIFGCVEKIKIVLLESNECILIFKKIRIWMINCWFLGSNPREAFEM
jgi:hypothetical protein